MEKMKLNVGFACFPYGGNGANAAEHPGIRHWMIKTICEMRDDPRIGKINYFDIADTPITMSRNKAILIAKERNIDVLVMLDSDNIPDFHLEGSSQYTGQHPIGRMKPFFSSSFDYLYEHYNRGPLMIGAPYCGPGPYRPVYVFKWETGETDRANDLDALEQMTRTEGSMMRGIRECAAIATGVLMIDMRLFQFEHDGDGILPPPWFYYEWEGNKRQCQDCGGRYVGYVGDDMIPWQAYQHQKASTEDVVFSRNVSLLGQVKLGYNTVLCNWDAWAGHMKIDAVGFPLNLGVDQVAENLVRAARGSARTDEGIVMVGE